MAGHRLLPVRQIVAPLPWPTPRVRAEIAARQALERAPLDVLLISNLNTKGNAASESIRSATLRNQAPREFAPPGSRRRLRPSLSLAASNGSIIFFSFRVGRKANTTKRRPPTRRPAARAAGSPVNSRFYASRGYPKSDKLSRRPALQIFFQIHICLECMLRRFDLVFEAHCSQAFR